jgi:hypothetical protein
MSTVLIPDFVKGEIYLITCNVTQDKYIGQTKTHGYKAHRNKWYPKGYKSRFEEHIQYSERFQEDKLTGLHAAIFKYGANNFTTELLHTCELDELNDWEMFHINWFDTYKNGYNLTEGGSYIPKDRIQKIGLTSISHKAKSEVVRSDLLEKRKEEISKISIEDTTTGWHAVVVWIYFNDNTSISWNYSDYQTDLWDCFIRAYSTISLHLDDDKIFVHYRLIHYLDGFIDSPYSHLLRKITAPTITTKQISDLEQRYDHYKNYDVEYVVLKLARKGSCYRIAMCIKSPDHNRLIISEFGGNKISVQDAVDGAFKLSEMLTSRDKIFIRPELLAFLNTNNVTLQWTPSIRRKPRTVKKKE